MISMVPFPELGPPGRRPRLSVVIPCYNEQAGIAELHRRMTAVCQDFVGDSYEVILVNDGSRDGTWQEIEKLVRRDKHIVGLSLSRNYGHQLALSAGLMATAGERILIIDADLQDPPELLPKMMALMDDGADIVYGQRSNRQGETWFKKTSASLFYRLLDRMVEIRIPLDTGDFRLMSRRALDVLNAMPEQHRFIRGMVSWIGLKQVALPYDRHERFAGETKYPFKKMLRFALDAITSFSIQPLRIASLLGMLFGLLGLLGIVYALLSWMSGETVSGWTSVILVVLVLGSVQLLVAGVTGEYLGRLYMEAKRRPLYVVDEVLRQESRLAAHAVADTKLQTERTTVN